MTIDPTLGSPTDLPPVSNEEAAKIVEQDEALQKAGRDTGGEDAATDEEAREDG